jgi:hypothetical protein
MQRGKEPCFLYLCRGRLGAETHIATHPRIHYNFGVEYPFPPVGIVGAADGKNRRAFFFLEGLLSQRIDRGLHSASRRHRVTLTALLLIVSKVFASKSGGC